MPSENRKEEKPEIATQTEISKKTGQEVKNEGKKRNPPTEYSTAYTEPPFSAREPIKPSAQFQLNAAKADNKTHWPVTEYNTSYFGKPYARVEPIIPKSELDWATGVFCDSTTMKNDYVSYTFEPPVRHHRPEWVKPGGQIEFSTSYAEEFPPRQIKTVAPIKPDPALRALDVKFKGEPTYSSDYRQWKVPEPPKRFQQIEYQPATVPFEAHPSYSSDFVPRPFAKSEPFIPVDNIVRLGDHPFEGSTNYKETFVKHVVTPRAIHEPEVYHPPKVPLDGTTSNKTDYQPLPLVKTESIRPRNEVKIPAGKIEDSTTTKDDYVEWPVERFRPKWQRPKWERSTEHVVYTTSHAEEFKPHEIKPIKRIRPPSRNRKLEAKLSSLTQYNEDYPRWDKTERVKPIIRQDYQSPTAPFVGHSTYMTTFITHPWQKPQRIKKDNRSVVLPLLSSEAPVEENVVV